MEKIFNSNMHCAGCKGNIEAALKKLDGVLEVNANLVNNVVKVRYNEKKVSEEDIINACKSVGYKLEVIDEDEEYSKEKSYKFDIIKLIIGIVLLLPLMFFSMSDMYPGLIPDSFKEPIYLLPIIELVLTLIIIGVFFNYYISGFKSLIKLSPNMDSLIFLGSLFSLIYSAYFIIKLIIAPSDYYIYEASAGKIMFHTYLDSAAMILVIVSIGKLIENLSKRKARSTINELLKLRPKYANLIKENEIVKVETKFLKAGDKIIIKEGETIPLDGVIINGSTSVDESLLTGESLPIYKEEGDKVIGGSVNKDGSITVLIDKSKKDNVLNKIISLVMEASNMDTKLTRKVDKVSRIFVPIILLISVIVFCIWLGIDYGANSGNAILNTHFTSAFDEAFSFAISVMVVSCPCALGLATPISLLVGSSIFAKNGILVNKSEAIENMKEIDCLVLDKTNTITNGKLTVNDYVIFTKNPAKLNRIYTIEKYSTHPLSEGIATLLQDKASLEKDFTMVSNVPGKGVKGVYNDETIYIGNESLVNEFYKGEENNVLIEKLSIYKKEGTLPIIAFTEKEIFALFSLKDELKKDAKEFIKEVKKSFKKVVLLTGDNEIIAHNIAEEVGIEEVIANVKPDGKGEVIKKLKEENYHVMMVGDGVNDSIALTLADVGVGIAKGSDVALASSDFILMNDDLLDILDIIKISKKIRTNISFNLLWAFLYNVVFIPVAAGAFASLHFVLSPMYASMLMALSSVTVCLNALTLFLYRRKTKNN